MLIKDLKKRFPVLHDAAHRFKRPDSILTEKGVGGWIAKAKVCNDMFACRLEYFILKAAMGETIAYKQLLRSKVSSLYFWGSCVPY